jgi:hypothetical protein
MRIIASPSVNGRNVGRLMSVTAACAIDGSWPCPGRIHGYLSTRPAETVASAIIVVNPNGGANHLTSSQETFAGCESPDYLFWL